MLRPLKPGDAADLKLTCWSERPLPLIETFLERCLKLMATRRGFAVVAEVNMQAVGFGLLTRWSGIGEISDLIITETLRNQGIGTAMIKRLAQAADEMGIASVEIGAAVSNPRAVALYERLGFAPSRTLMLDLGNGREPVTYLIKYVGRGLGEDSAPHPD